MVAQWVKMRDCADAHPVTLPAWYSLQPQKWRSQREVISQSVTLINCFLACWCFVRNWNVWIAKFSENLEMPVSDPVSMVTFTDFAIKLLIKVSLQTVFSTLIVPIMKYWNDYMVPITLMQCSPFSSMANGEKLPQQNHWQLLNSDIQYMVAVSNNVTH